MLICDKPLVVVSSENEQIVADSSVSRGTDDREAHPKAWYVAVVKMNCERRVSKQLATLNIENFVPLQREIHMWSDRRKQVDRVVIPMTIFVLLDTTQLQLLYQLPLVSCLMRLPGESKPSPVPTEQVERFRQMLKCTEAPVSIEQAPLIVGESLRIVKGSLRGLCGEMVRTIDNKSHIIIRLGCLGCASIDLPADYVERFPSVL